MSLRLRQVALAATDLERTVVDLTAVFDLGRPYADPGVGVFGLHNAVFALDDTFLEVVSPLRDDAPAARFLARKGGDAGYMAIFQTDDLARERARIEALGVRIVFETAFDDIATIHLHPRDVGAAIVSIDEAHPPHSWRWAGRAWTTQVHTAVTGAIRGVEVASRDPTATAERWSHVLGVPRSTRDGDELRVDGGRVRFVACEHDRGEGIVAIEVEAHDLGRIRDAATERGHWTSSGDVAICGTTFRLV